jgi:hypothetical protein
MDAMVLFLKPLCCDGRTFACALTNLTDYPNRKIKVLSQAVYGHKKIKRQVKATDGPMIKKPDCL